MLDSKPRILQSWKTKLLVFILCAISFFAGWESSTAHKNEQCWQAGGQIVLVNDMSFCERP